MSEYIETADVDTTPARRGRRPDPVVRVRRAKQRLEKTQRDAAKVQVVANALAEAQAEYNAAVAALQADLDSLALDTDNVGDADE